MTINTQNLQSLGSGLPRETLDKMRAVLKAQDDMNTAVAQALNQPDGQWLRPQYVNGWTDSSATRIIRYRLEATGIVRVEGALASGTPGTTAFTLPPTMRPYQVLVFATSGGALFADCVVFPNGNVEPRTTAGQTLAFSFAAAATPIAGS